MYTNVTLTPHVYKNYETVVCMWMETIDASALIYDMTVEGKEQLEGKWTELTRVFA